MVYELGKPQHKVLFVVAINIIRSTAECFGSTIIFQLLLRIASIDMSIYYLLTYFISLQQKTTYVWVS